MSLLGFDTMGTATINGLTEINANNVFSDVLYYDADTTPVNVKTAIDGISVDVTALEADVLTLQGEMITAYSNISTLNGEVNTLQSEMNTAQSDINALQSDMSTAQTDIGVLYGLTATNTTAITGLSVSQAAQDVTIASNSAAIGVLQGEVSTAEANIVTLQVKTTDQSWSSLTGTTFSGRLNVGTTGAGIVLNQASTSTFGSAITVGSGSGVTLNTASASTFSSGLNSTRTEPLSATSAFQLCDNQTSGFMNIGCNTNRSGGGINIGGGTNNTSPININAFCTGNAPITIGSSASSGQVVAIRGTNVTVGSTNTTSLTFVAAPASNVFFSRNATGGSLIFGNDTGTASTNALSFNIGSANTGAINFGTGASAKTITFGNTAATISIRGTTTIAGITNINTTTLNNTTIGNGPAGGNITLNGAINAITGTTNINSTGGYGTTIGNTSGTVTVKSGILDISANNAITIYGGTTTTITSINDLTLQTTNPFGDILVSSAGTSTYTSVGLTTINSAALDINATGALTIDTTDNITIQADGNTINALVAGNQIQATTSTLIQSGTTTTLTSTGETEINCAALDINATGIITIDTDDPINLNSSANGINLTSFGEQDITCGSLDINSGGVITIDAISNTTLVSGGTNTFTSTGTTTINSAALDINASGAVTLISTGGAVTVNTTGVESTIIGNPTGILTVKGATTNINGSGSTGDTNIGNATGTLTVTGTTNVNGATTITGATNINTTGTATTNIGVASITSGDTTIRGQNMSLEAYDSISLEATNGFWTNIGANNFYFRSYNSAPSIIMGSQTTATDYFSISATSTGTTLDSLTQPLTLNGSQVNVSNAAMSGANISESTVELISPLAMDATYTTYPITTANRVGRFTSTTSTTKSTTSPTNVISLSIPSQGCYIVEGGFIWSGTFTAEQYSTLSISTTSATLDNTRISVLYLGGAAGGYSNRLTSVVNFSAGGTVYLVGQVPTTLNAATVQSNYMAATRIA